MIDPKTGKRIYVGMIPAGDYHERFQHRPAWYSNCADGFKNHLITRTSEDRRGINLFYMDEGVEKSANVNPRCRIAVKSPVVSQELMDECNVVE